MQAAHQDDPPAYEPQNQNQGQNNPEEEEDAASVEDSITEENGEPDAIIKDVRAKFRRLHRRVGLYEKGAKVVRELERLGFHKEANRLRKYLRENPYVNVILVGDTSSGKSNYVNNTLYSMDGQMRQWEERAPCGNGVNRGTVQPNCYTMPFPVPLVLIDDVGGEPERASELVDCSTSATHFRDNVYRRQNAPGLLPRGPCDFFLIFHRVSFPFSSAGNGSNDPVPQWVKAVKEKKPFLVILTHTEDLTEDEVRTYRKDFCSNLQLGQGSVHTLKPYPTDRLDDENPRDAQLDIANLKLWDKIFNMIDYKIMNQYSPRKTLFNHLGLEKHLFLGTLLILPLLFAGLMYVGIHIGLPWEVCCGVLIPLFILAGSVKFSALDIQYVVRFFSGV